MFFCVACGCRMRKFNKKIEYLGICCSKCYRMSDKNYYKLVDKISKIKIDYILKELEKIKK